MMNISKISRSIVVVIFVALIIFLGYLDVSFILNQAGNPSSVPVWFKIAYIITLICLVAIYIYIKDKLYRTKIKRNISLIYRYIYITIASIVISIIVIYGVIEKLTSLQILAYLVLKIGIGFLLKKIIFNVSKSDILSVLGIFVFCLMPDFADNLSTRFTSLLITLSVFAAILVIQKLIDELKQRGLRTKKYIIEAVILGFLIGISNICGINVWVWVIIAVISLFITSNLDNTHISFPKKVLDSLTQEKREKLYKLERINISKLFIAIIVIIIIAVIISILGNLVISKINIQNDIINNIVQISSGQTTGHIDISNILNNIHESSITIVSSSKIYYLIILLYIVFIEILSVFLHRRYDTKSTLLKILFVLVFISIAVYGLNIVFFQPLLTTLLLLIAIVNTSNIYLNREERIKMLVA